MRRPKAGPLERVPDPTRAGQLTRCIGCPIDQRGVGPVVSVVGARPRVDASVGVDPNLVALPVVAVIAGRPEDRAGGGGVAVVGPVLDVDPAGALAGTVVSGSSRQPQIAAIDHVGESGGGAAGKRSGHAPALGSVVAFRGATGVKVDR